eukprot:1057606-Karenia_brevis.AAC.1
MRFGTAGSQTAHMRSTEINLLLSTRVAAKPVKELTSVPHAMNRDSAEDLSFLAKPNALVRSRTRPHASYAK